MQMVWICNYGAWERRKSLKSYISLHQPPLYICWVHSVLNASSNMFVPHFSKFPFLPIKNYYTCWQKLTLTRRNQYLKHIFKDEQAHLSNSTDM